MSKQQIGVVGMAVMGATLRSTSKAVVIPSLFFNRSREKTEEVIAENPGKKLVPLLYGEKSLLNLWKRLVASC